MSTKVKVIALFAAAVAAVLELVSPARSQELERPPENAAARARAKMLIESLLKEREKIVSAVVEVRGSQAFRRNDPLPEWTIRGMGEIGFRVALCRVKNRN